MLRHTQKKNFVCVVCDKGMFYYIHQYVQLIISIISAFYNNSSLKAHQIIHTGNPNIPCHACGKLFFSKQALKLHHLHHHQAPTLKCEQCDKMYGLYYLIQLHISSCCFHVYILGTLHNQSSTITRIPIQISRNISVNIVVISTWQRII